MLTIAVFPNTSKPEAPAVLQRILAFYEDKDVRIIMPVEEARIFQHAGYGVTDIENVKTDIALSIGGDGTLLGVCRRYSHHAVPVCGVNIGTLGFMADIELHELEKKLQKLLDGDYRIEQRLLLAGSVIVGRQGALPRPRHQRHRRQGRRRAHAAPRPHDQREPSARLQG